MVAALALTRLMTTLLFEVSATDWMTFTVIAEVLSLVTLIACWLPSRRAAHIDPLTAVRHD